ncbi:hypothetical protein SAMN02745704_01635 [Paucidesulfovibrio gracilis DSM 16080]|uniref:Uncharacterized protein n=1 Tax=Paucidesulfovibrio gracilis DSM 16080 TaxID=1121449 RepID=A0A1T4X3E7_9BACT|nr:hypothetical protein [Paucidesulfovibrio gracilis]SKA83391.1 hypothetical protein SAMN02745704_01635 [Paucidesulfovibrio gracilis DSM 16080]
MELNSVSTPVPQTPTNSDRSGQADMMKDIRKARLQRQVMADPSLASKLVSVEATATYNASGNLVQAVGGNLGDV